MGHHISDQMHSAYMGCIILLLPLCAISYFYLLKIKTHVVGVTPSMVSILVVVFLVFLIIFFTKKLDLSIRRLDLIGLTLFF